jgi:hypothetical protein
MSINNIAVAGVSTVAKKAGRPAFEIKYPKGMFTVDELFDLNNSGKSKKVKCKLTIRNHIQRDLETGVLKQVGSVKTGKAGQPAIQYIRATVWAALEAARAGRLTKANTPTTDEPSPAVSVDTPVTETVSETAVSVAA